MLRKLNIGKHFRYVALAMSFFVISGYCLAQEAFEINHKDGKVGFAGEHAGMQFSGQFKVWNAQLKLPSDIVSPEDAFVNAEFDLSTAETGDATYDETLPEGDWFDVDKHPKGVFKSDSVTPSTNGYEVAGQLSLRGQAHPVSFTLQKAGARLQSRFVIDRLAYGIGMESDPEADWVSRDIALSLDIPQP